MVVPLWINSILHKNKKTRTYKGEIIGMKSEFLICIFFILIISGCVQQPIREKEALKVELREVLVGSKIKLENVTYVPFVNYTKEFNETITTQFILIPLYVTKELFKDVLGAIFNATPVNESEIVSPVYTYRAEGGKVFVITYLAIKNEWNATIKGHLEGKLFLFLKLEKMKKP